MSVARSRWPRVVVLALVAIAMGVIAKGYRTYRWVRGTFHDLRGPVAAPADVAPRLRDVALRTPKGTAIAGWYLPSRRGAVVVYAHGSSGDRRELLAEALSLEGVGYGALLLDLPGHGESGGEPLSGRDDQAAIAAGVDFVSAQGARRIGAYGFSMGSSVVAHVAASDPRIDAVLLAGAFTNGEDQLRFEYRRWGPLSSWPAVWAAQREGLAFDELRTADVIARIAPRPLFIVGGSSDSVVPESMERELYALAREPKELDIILGAGHGDYARVAGSAYRDRVRAFFDRAFGL